MRLKIEYRNLGDLVNYERNTRLHSQEQVEEIAASIRAFGFTNPVLLDESDVIIAGHGRCMAAPLAGLDEVPAIKLTGLSETQKKALRIADNRIPLNAAWDMDMLAQEVQGLELEEFDLDVLGFSDEELSGLLDMDAPPGPGDGDGESDGPASGVQLDYLKWGEEKVQISQEESEELSATFSEYVKKHGTHYGFVTWLASRD